MELTGKGIIDGYFMMMMNIVRAYVDADFKLCTPLHLVCTLNYNSGGYNCIVEVIQHDHVHINSLIAEHDSCIKHLMNLYGRTRDFEFARNHKSINLCSYSVQDDPGVFSHDYGGTSKEHGERDSASDTEILEGETDGGDEIDEDNEIMDEYLNVDEAALADAPDVRLSTG